MFKNISLFVRNPDSMGCAYDTDSSLHLKVSCQIKRTGGVLTEQMDIYCVTSQLKGFPRTFPHSRDTPQSSLRGNLAIWIRLETAGFAWSQNKTTTTSQHGTLQSGYLPVPVYFRRCPLAAPFAFPVFCFASRAQLAPPCSPNLPQLPAVPTSLL